MINKYRILLVNNNYEIEFKCLTGWCRVTEWLGCDPLGFDYGYGNIQFETIQQVEEYIKKNEAEKVIKYV